jgi:purine-binding chemotaxis protein CheW
MARGIHSVGESRADRQTADDDPDRQYRHLILRIGRHLCAVPLARVVEIMRELPVEPLAGAPAYVAGLCIVRGDPVPVVDAARLISGEAGPARRLVTVRAGERTVALAVDDALGIFSVEGSELKELPPLMHEAAAETIAGIGRLDEELLLVLRTARIVPQDVLDRVPDREARP